MAPPTPGAPTLSLAQAVAVALERNFGLLAEADSVAVSRFSERAARARFLPQVSPSVSWSDDQRRFGLEASQRLPWTGGTLTAAGSFLQPDSDALDTSEVRLQLAQPLLRGFGPTFARFDLENSRRNRQDQERSFELSRQRLAVDVTAAYYLVIRQRQLLQVAQRSAERSDALRAASEARLEVGLASKLDVLRAELQASRARNSAVVAQTGLESALESFRALLGLSPSVAVEPAAVALPESAAFDVAPVEVLVQRALANRLELQQARDQIDDARRAHAVARQRLLPQLDLNLAVAQTGLGSGFGDAWRTGDRRLDIFVSTSYPVERSADRAASAIAELGVAARQRSLRQRELQVEAEVRAAARQLESIRKSVELQGQDVDVADQQHRLATLRYERGLASNFDVVDAEERLVQARSALVGLLTEFQVARVRLLQVTGELDVEADFVRREGEP